MLNMIRDYPVRYQDYKDLRDQKTSAGASGASSGMGSLRPVENIAQRSLPPQEQREYDAVCQAIERTKRLPDAALRLGMIRLTLWRAHNSIPQAASILNISDRTARRYRQQFILLVGLTYGFLTNLEYMEAIKNDN